MHVHPVKCGLFMPINGIGTNGYTPPSDNKNMLPRDKWSNLYVYLQIIFTWLQHRSLTGGRRWLCLSPRRSSSSGCEGL